MPVVKEKDRLSGERRMLPVGFARFIATVTKQYVGLPLVTGVGVPPWERAIPNFGSIHLTDRRGISIFEAATLVPIGISRRLVARCIQFGNLSRGQVPAYGTQILA
jgi:hypothetical protein